MNIYRIFRYTASSLVLALFLSSCGAASESQSPQFQIESPLPTIEPSIYPSFQLVLDRDGNMLIATLDGDPALIGVESAHIHLYYASAYIAFDECDPTIRCNQLANPPRIEMQGVIPLTAHFLVNTTVGLATMKAISIEGDSIVNDGVDSIRMNEELGTEE